MILDPAHLGPLLADATLLEVRRAPTGLTLWLDCLRRAPDGAPLPPVQLTLLNVWALAVSYDGTQVDTRPSRVHVPAPARVAEVVPWVLEHEAACQFNSEQEDEDLALAAQVDWLQGDPEAYTESDVRLRVRPTPRASWPELAVDVWIGAAAVTARSGGKALSVERWRQQADHWWLYWAEHWQDDPALLSLDTLHAVPMRHGCPDLTYRPPAVPAFTAIGTSDCPVELLAPLRAWHEGLLRRDWLRMAWAFPHLDRGVREHAEHLRGECLGPGFGRWGYVHHVDGWWVEGARAGVVLRGVEHVLGLDGADDRPVRWHYSLRRRSMGWSIHGFRTADVEEPAVASGQ